MIKLIAGGTKKPQANPITTVYKTTARKFIANAVAKTAIDQTIAAPDITIFLEYLLETMPANILDMIKGIIITGPVNIAYL